MPELPNPAYHPQKQSIGELLAMTNPAIVVPDWQRNFSWKREHTDTFWNDLMKFVERAGDPIKSEYFFGSIVLVGGSTEQVLLLDGQQRLATSMILLASIRDALRPLEKDSSDWIQKTYLADYNPIKNKHIHKLRLNVYDRDFFQRLVSEARKEGYQLPAPEHASHKLIKAAKDYFDEQIALFAEGKDPALVVNWLKRLMNALAEHFTVIAAYSDNEDNAAEVFETLNDRGIGLSTPDLLRNLIIRRGADGQKEQIVKSWEDVIAFESDSHIKAFLRHHWISRYGDVKTQSLYREVKETVERENIASLELSNQLSDSAKLYRRLRSADVDSEEAASILDAIGSLGAGATILFPGLLSIFEALEGDPQEKALTALMNVYVRDGIIGDIENSQLENRFYSAARDLRATKDVAAFCAALANKALGDDEVRNRFQRLSLSHNGQRRYLLYKLELAKRGTEEIDIASPSKVHVEHIYPQKPEAGQKWENHDRWINRLGNLTLLDRRLNSAIKNGVFAAKKPHYEKSEIQMTKELTAHDGWDTERVTTRQAELAGLAVETWPIIT